MSDPAGRGLACKTGHLKMHMQEPLRCPDGMQTVHVAHAMVAIVQGAWAKSVRLLHGLLSTEGAS